MERSEDLDFQKLLDDTTFTFVIGKERKRYNIHVSAFTRISEPLRYMMTNNKMIEAIRGEAFIEDADPETFTLLAKFAYNGLSGLSPIRSYSKQNWFEGFQCLMCGSNKKFSADETCYPFCTQHHSDQYDAVMNGSDVDSLHCLYPNCKAYWSGDRGGKVLCNDHDTVANRHQYTFLMRNDDTRFANEAGFHKRRYSTSKFSYSTMSHFFAIYNMGLPARCDLLTYAKLYVLADKYMVIDLPMVSLHSLFGSLVEMSFSDTTVDMIVQLILYTYEHTSSNKSSSNVPIDGLRNLVMYFAAEDGRFLVKYAAFKTMLAENEELAAEIFDLSSEPFDVEPSDGKRKATPTVDDEEPSKRHCPEVEHTEC